MKVAIVDIETTDLSAVGMGFILCACVLPDEDNAKPKTIKLDFTKHNMPGRERDLIRRLIVEINKYDLIIGHNLKFDLSYIQSRAVILGIPPIVRFPMFYDTMSAFANSKLRTCLNRIGKPTKSLAMVVDLLHIPQEKTALYPEERAEIVWDGSRKRMRELVDHCKKDVQMTRRVLGKILKLDPKPVIKRFV